MQDMPLVTNSDLALSPDLRPSPAVVRVMHEIVAALFVWAFGLISWLYPSRAPAPAPKALLIDRRMIRQHETSFAREDSFASAPNSGGFPEFARMFEASGLTPETVEPVMAARTDAVVVSFPGSRLDDKTGSAGRKANRAIG